MSDAISNALDGAARDLISKMKTERDKLKNSMIMFAFFSLQTARWVWGFVANSQEFKDYEKGETGVKIDTERLLSVYSNLQEVLAFIFYPLHASGDDEVYKRIDDELRQVLFEISTMMRRSQGFM